MNESHEAVSDVLSSSIKKTQAQRQLFSEAKPHVGMAVFGSAAKSN